MRARLVLAAVGAAATMLVAGCSGAAPSGSGGNSGGNAGGKVTLNWWMVTQNDSGTKAISKIISDYEKQNPGVTIKVQYRAVDAHKDALRTSAGTSTAPDIYYNWSGPGLGGELVKSGVSLDLTKYYDQYNWKSRFKAATLKTYSQYGGYHGVPWTQRTEVVYYNKDQFQKAGISAPPTTYAEWQQDAQKLKDAGLTAITMGGKENWHVMRLLDTFIETNCGASLGDQLNTTKVSWANQPCINKSFEQLKQWADNYFNKGFAGISVNQASALFYAGKSAMQLEGDWFTQNIIDNGGKIDNVGIFPLPTGTNRLYGFSEGMYITKTSKNPDAAAKFLDYLTSAQVEGADLGIFGAVPVNVETKPTQTQQPINVAIGELTKKASGFFLNNDQNFSTELTTEYWRIQNGVTAGSINPDDAGAQMQKFISSHPSS